MTARENIELVTFGWVDAVRRSAPERIAPQLAPDIVWQGLLPDLSCGNRDEVLANLRDGPGLLPHVRGFEVASLDEEHVLLAIRLVDVPDLFGVAIPDGELCQVFTIHDGVVRRIDEFPVRDAALAAVRHNTLPPPADPDRPRALVTQVIPILNVTDIGASVAWFETLGWTAGFQWVPDDSDGDPVFGGVTAGGHEVYLCRDDQGERGAWISVFVDDVREVHDRCVAADLDIIHPLTDEPWGIREFRVRHPDGHVLRIGQFADDRRDPVTPSPADQH